MSALLKVASNSKHILLISTFEPKIMQMSALGEALINLFLECMSQPLAIKLFNLFIGPVNRNKWSYYNKILRTIHQPCPPSLVKTIIFCNSACLFLQNEVLFDLLDILQALIFRKTFKLWS